MRNVEDGHEAKSADEFDWVVYSDATLAGLSAMIPIPYVDSTIERYFRLRMLPTIAARNNVALHPQVNKIVNHVRFDLIARAGGCLLWPVGLAMNAFRRIFRKFLYVLTVKRAIDQLSHYWQRAFLLNHMVQQGYLTDPALVYPASQTLQTVLRAHDDGPLVGLAREVIGASAGWLGNPTLPRIGRIRSAQSGIGDIMRGSWASYTDFFEGLRREYEQALAQETTPARDHGPRQA